MLLGVKQMIPAFAASRRDATSVLHRAPLSISADESQGLIALMILGSHPRRASAAARLRSPDQLMNTSIAATIMAQGTAFPLDNGEQKTIKSLKNCVHPAQAGMF